MFAFDLGEETQVFEGTRGNKIVFGTYRYISFYSIFQTKFGRKFYRAKHVTVTESEGETITATIETRPGQEISLREAEKYLEKTLLPWYAFLGNQSVLWLVLFGVVVGVVTNR